MNINILLLLLFISYFRYSPLILFVILYDIYLALVSLSLLLTFILIYLLSITIYKRKVARQKG